MLKSIGNRANNVYRHSKTRDTLITKCYWNQINCSIEGSSMVLYSRCRYTLFQLPSTVESYYFFIIWGSIYIEDFGSNIIHFNLMDIWYEPHLTNWLLMNYQHTHTALAYFQSIRIGLHLCRLIGLWFCSSSDNDLLHCWLLAFLHIFPVQNAIQHDNADGIHLHIFFPCLFHLMAYDIQL